MLRSSSSLAAVAATLLALAGCVALAVWPGVLVSTNMSSAPLLGWLVGCGSLLSGVLLLALALRLGIHERRRLGALAAWAADQTETTKRTDDDFVDFDILAQWVPQIRYLAEGVSALREQNHALSEELAQERRNAQQARSEADEARDRAVLQREQGLASTAETLGGAVEGIERATEMLQIAAARAGDGADQQRGRLASAASATDEMNSTVLEVARSAEQASSAAGQARERAAQGSLVVDRTVQGILAVSSHATELAGMVSELGRQADSINDIMGLISDIADQTNLLALNAAIEAARAGDAGRGFAVVADEVRKLAEKTMSATSEVHRTVDAIHGGVTRASAGMEETSRLVTEAVELARESRQSLDEIVSLSESSSGRVQSIAVAADQQSKASEEINRTIMDVSRIASTTSKEMEQAGQAVAELADQVRQLAVINQVFELVGGGAPRTVVQELAEDPDMRSMRRDRQESALQRAMRRHSFLELLYATDAKGIQTVSNVSRPEHASDRDGRAFGKDWSKRLWYTGAMESGAFSLSSVYVSATSGEECITVSIPMRDASGRILGVVAADVRVGI
ncbi:MAG: methyl-accepting chemotaxis protein [Desulfovibrio sp.]